MRMLLVFPYYVHWHYGHALKNIGVILRNYIWFFWNFFSIGLLTRTLFAPWRRIQEHNERGGLDLAAFFSAFIVNSIMRMTGAIIRTIFIILGLIAIVLVFCAGVVFYIVWLVLPLVVIFLILLSGFFFKNIYI